MADRRGQTPRWRLWSSTRRAFVALLAVAFVVGFVAFCGAVVHAMVSRFAAPGWASGDIEWSTVIALGAVVYTLGHIAWMMGTETVRFLGESVPVVVQDAREVIDEAGALRQDARARQARQDAQGGALSMSSGSDGGDLTEVVSSEGRLGLAEDVEEEVSGEVASR